MLELRLNNELLIDYSRTLMVGSGMRNILHARINLSVFDRLSVLCNCGGDA